MKIEVNDAAKSQKEIKVEIPVETYDKALEAECDLVAKEAKIPGFRPGKAPRDVVKKQHAHKIKSTAIEKLINNAIRDALTSNGINPLSSPMVTNVDHEDGKPFSFTAMVDVFPVLNIEKYKDFNFERTVIKTADADVDKAIEQVLEKGISYQAIEKKRGVKDGDQVVMDFSGMHNGAPLSGGKADNYTLDVGQGRFIPDFEAGLKGMKVGETKTFPAKFPEDYNQKNLAGETVEFTVTVHEIKEKVTPVLDDEFVKKVDKKSKNVAEFKARIKHDLQEDADSFTRLEAFGAMLDKIAENNPFELPASIVDEQAGRLAQQNLQQYYQMGINPEMFGLSVDSMKPRFIPDAEKLLKRALIINALSETQKVEVSPEDIDAQLKKIADMNDMSFEDIKKEAETAGHMAGIANDIMSEKLFDFLCTVNKVKERVMTKAEYDEERAKASKAAEAKAEKAEKDDEEEKPAKKKPAAKKTATKKTDKDSQED